MSTGRRKQQYVLAGLGAAGIGAGLWAIGAVMNQGQASLVGGQVPAGRVDETLVEDRTSAAGPEMSWITASARHLEALEKEMEKLREDLARGQDAANSALQAVIDETGETIVAQQARINALEAALQANRAGDPASPRAAGEIAGGALRTASLEAGGAEFLRPAGSGGRLNPLAQAAGQGAGQGGGVASGRGAGVGPGLPGDGGDGRVQPAPPAFGVSFALAPRPEAAASGSAAVARKSLGHYLPAGSYAPALVISGVDASTGVVGQDNPIPVTMRVTGPAVTAGQGTIRGRTVNITGCMVLGSARGDLSSERVHVRLTKMTCLSGDAVLEADIAGYMSGSGKAGMRGRVVSREGNLTTNAAIAGALQGLASGLSGGGDAVAGADTASIPDILKAAGIASVAQGTATAADTLADYYIRRAEQYQPVVSLYGGSTVEIVFLEGVDFSERGQ